MSSLIFQLFTIFILFFSLPNFLFLNSLFLTLKSTTRYNLTCVFLSSYLCLFGYYQTFLNLLLFFPLSCLVYPDKFTLLQFLIIDIKNTITNKLSAIILQNNIYQYLKQIILKNKIIQAISISLTSLNNKINSYLEKYIPYEQINNYFINNDPTNIYNPNVLLTNKNTVNIRELDNMFKNINTNKTDDLNDMLDIEFKNINNPDKTGKINDMMSVLKNIDNEATPNNTQDLNNMMTMLKNIDNTNPEIIKLDQMVKNIGQLNKTMPNMDDLNNMMNLFSQMNETNLTLDKKMKKKIKKKLKRDHIK